MSNVVDSYRRSHADTAPRKSRCRLFVGALVGLIAVGGSGAAMFTGRIGPPATMTAAANEPAVAAPHAAAKTPAGAGDVAVGSTSKLPRPTARGIMDGPVTGLIIVGIGLMTGLMVYLGLGRLLPAGEPAPHPYQLVRGRKEITQERRYHGGPIRD